MTYSLFEVDHLHSLVICFHTYLYALYTSLYNKHQALIEEIGKSERHGIVVPTQWSAHANQSLILSAWSDAVVGGEGCWTTAWAPTSKK